jgi:cobalt/nickel transport protein
MKDNYWVYGIIAALFLAGFISLYASSYPDGLERVAEDHKFLEKGEGKEVIESPMADYIVPGIENDSLSASLAGVAGVLILCGLWLFIGKTFKKTSKHES